MLIFAALEGLLDNIPTEDILKYKEYILLNIGHLQDLLKFSVTDFNYVFNKHYNPLMYGQEPWFDRTHNVVLDWMINAGFLGLVSYLGLFATAIYMLWFRKNNISSLERSLLTGLLAAYFFHNLFDLGFDFDEGIASFF